MIKRMYSVFAFSFLILVSCSTTNIIQEDTDNSSSVVYHGADPTGKVDASHAFRKALATANDMISVPKGTYVINETIDLQKHLLLMPGVVIKKTKEGNDGPIFWLTKSYAKLEGANKKCEIKSERTSPNGIIRIGHKHKGVSGKNILFVEVESLTITGQGPTDKTSNIGLYFFNAQAKGDGKTTSYFHTINNVIIQHLDCGILMEGMSNANSISNVILNRVGLGSDDVAIHLSGAMENRIFDVFHHYSKNATTLLLDTYIDKNNVEIRPSYNYISHIISEQGGQKAKCANIKSGFSNNIAILCNANGGNVRYKRFNEDKNIMQIN